MNSLKRSILKTAGILVISSKQKGNNMQKQIRELANTSSALEAIRKGLIRCGFELEFHDCDNIVAGLGSDEDDRGHNPWGIEESSKVEVGTDSSVRGGEIRTLGALTPTEFMAAASALFKNHEFEIDTGCSFHIHLSVPGIKHSYGANLQAEMQAYILAHQERLPERVRERLASDAIRFCKFQLNTDKFSAVHGHPQRTWEFRLFGNIDSAYDAWRCLLLAIDALRHAYQVRCRIADRLTPEDGRFDKLAEQALERQVSLAKIVRYNKLFKNAESAA